MTASREFPYDRASITAARRYVSDLIVDLPAEQAFEVELMVSELATNCITHTGSGFVTAVEVGTTGLYVEVTDTGPGRPRLQVPRPSDLTGRGLFIIDALSSEWGVRETDGDRGKTVWFTYLLPPSAGRPMTAPATRRPSRRGGSVPADVEAE